MSHELLEPFPPPRRQALRRRLLRWHKQHGRELPWRNVRDPYRVWLSEIMLQQTTVKAVIPYYERFLARFPTVQDLARASESDVLQLWEGLGYYSRGRNLHRAAQCVTNEFNGIFPSELAQLRELPGVGRYTAGAIRSFGHNLPAPILEANTLRLYARLLGMEVDPRGAAAQATLWKFAELLQPRDGAGEFNQSLLDLGATVCTPRQPACERCPLKSDCVAFANGRQQEIPIRAARPAVTEVVEATVALRAGDQFLLRQRQPGERWAGLWDFPRWPVSSMEFAQPMTKRRLLAVWKEIQPTIAKLLDGQAQLETASVVMELKHAVTRYSIRLLCLESPLPKACQAKKGSQLRWLTLGELAELPMPVTGRKFARRLMDQGAVATE